MELELGSRSWSPDLLLLRDRFPRQDWADNPALGDLAHFWLHKHATIRVFGAHVTLAGLAMREGRVAADQLQADFIPPLQRFLGALESHHQVEDDHYFPVFRSLDRRLAPGFEILERDHGVLHGQIATVVDLARRFVRQRGTDRGSLRASAEAYSQAVDILARGLDVHLGDEEDLVIPLLASRSG